jgi:hypothetical protein
MNYNNKANWGNSQNGTILKTEKENLYTTESGYCSGG